MNKQIKTKRNYEKANYDDVNDDSCCIRIWTVKPSRTS